MPGTPRGKAARAREPGPVVSQSPAGTDLDGTGSPIDGHEWCATLVNQDPALIDDWSPHNSFCVTSCLQRAAGQTQSFLVAQTDTTARNAMSCHDDLCRGPFVVGGQRKESFTPVQKQRIEFRRQTYRGAGTANPLQDVCAGAGGDFDHDGICQDDDNCLFVKNTSQVNQDSDATGDACDPAPTLADGLGFLVHKYGFEGTDSDGDGLLNCEDRDDDTYRGSIPAGMLRSRPVGAEYDDVCWESADFGGNGPTRSADTSAPPRGTAWYYVVTGENGVAEGPAGFVSFGVPRYPPDPCVTPP